MCPPGSWGVILSPLLLVCMHAYVRARTHACLPCLRVLPCMQECTGNLHLRACVRAMPACTLLRARMHRQSATGYGHDCSSWCHHSVSHQYHINCWRITRARVSSKWRAPCMRLLVGCREVGGVAGCVGVPFLLFLLPGVAGCCIVSGNPNVVTHRDTHCIVYVFQGSCPG